MSLKCFPLIKFLNAFNVQKLAIWHFAEIVWTTVIKSFIFVLDEYVQ